MEPGNNISDRFREKTTPFIKELAVTSEAIKKMYFFDPENEDIPANLERDILLEKVNSPVKGLVHKFENSVAVFLSYTCAANCRYCERQDRVGVGLDKQGFLREEEIDKILEYIRARPNIREVVLSGGDPLMNPKGVKYFCLQAAGIDSVKCLRIHTKLPVQAPEQLNLEVLEDIVGSKEVFYLSIHINHPDELNPYVVDKIRAIRKMGFVMLSQSVFLNGINNSEEVLFKLFTSLSEIGVRPYYIYHCQAIPTTKRFVMSLEEEVLIMTELRKRLPGTAYPSHVIDLQQGFGKVIVPTDFWNLDLSEVHDFRNKKIYLKNDS